MPILGAHMSIGGGYYRSVERAHEVGCDCVQLFTKNNNQWRAKAISEADAESFCQALQASGVSHPLSHASYLINLASPKDDLWEKSVAAFAVELQRADQLGIPYVVLHPGSHTTSTPEEGLAAVARGLDEVHARVGDIGAQCLLENTAGQGSNLGFQFEHLAVILDRVDAPDRVGVCIDTCHTFAAGYALESADEYADTFSQLDTLVGLEKVKAFHLNDSKKEFASRRDRHENIGEGCMGLEPFRHLVNDARFEKVPMYLETPKGVYEPTDEDWDTINLRTLRRLAAAE